MRRKTRRTRKTRRRKTKRRRTPARSRRCELFRGNDTVASVGTPYTQSAANLQWEKKDFALNQINLSGGIIFSVGIEAAASVDGYERGQMRAYMELMAATEDKNLDPKARKFMQSALKQHSADAKSGKGGLSSYFVAGAYVTAAAVLAAAGYMAYSAGIFGKVGGWISSFTSSAKNAAMPFAKQYMHDKMGVPKEQINQVLGAGDESGGAWYNPFSWWRQQATRPGHLKTKNAVRKAGAATAAVGCSGHRTCTHGICSGCSALPLNGRAHSQQLAHAVRRSRGRSCLPLRRRASR